MPGPRLRITDWGGSGCSLGNCISNRFSGDAVLLVLATLHHCPMPFFPFPCPFSFRSLSLVLHNISLFPDQYSAVTSVCLGLLDLFFLVFFPLLLVNVYLHFLFNVVQHSADVWCRDLAVHFSNICVEKLEGAERDPGRSRIMVRW